MLKYLDSKASLNKEFSRAGKSFLGREDNLSKLSDKIFDTEPKNNNNGKNDNAKSHNQPEGLKNNEVDNKSFHSYTDEEKVKILMERNKTKKIVLSKDGKSEFQVIGETKLDKKFKRKTKKKTKKKAADFALKQNLIYINNQTGQYMQKGEPIPGMNIYNDLNYGDMIFIWKNTLIDFMIDEKEEVIEKIYMLDKAEKRRKKPLGQLKKKDIEKMRIEEEQRSLKKELREREKQEKLFNSLGFKFKKEFLRNRKKDKKMKDHETNDEGPLATEFNQESPEEIDKNIIIEEGK